jgi:type II secretory pathway predicted ATPase ExeA
LKPEDTPSIAEFFSWRRHPFADTYVLSEPYLAAGDQRICQAALQLLKIGKSFAITGPSGTGKSTLGQHILAKLDHHHYRPVFIPYGGLPRSGILRAVADALGVDPSGRRVPLIVRLHKHIQELAANNHPHFPVFLIDDAQLLERESLMDLCSLMATPHKNTVSASLILLGDQSFDKTLDLHIMTPIRTRLTALFKTFPLCDAEARDFVQFRLHQAHAPKDLFDPDAIDLLARHCRGNRRQIMNTAAILLQQAHTQSEKTIGPQRVLGCQFIDFSD